jgi:CheY-like chemotaxis protein
MSDPVILAIDDDELDLMALHRAVREANIPCSVKTFSDPEAALAVLEGDSPLNPLLILLDLNMPTMTGFEMLAHLKAEPEAAPDSGGGADHFDTERRSRTRLRLRGVWLSGQTDGLSPFRLYGWRTVRLLD